MSSAGEHRERTANVSVFVRLRPDGDGSGGSAGGSGSCLAVSKADSTIKATAPPRLAHTWAATGTTQPSSKGKGKQAPAWTFNVNHILDQGVRQAEVFDTTARDMVQQLVQGCVPEATRAGFVCACVPAPVCACSCVRVAARRCARHSVRCESLRCT